MNLKNFLINWQTTSAGILMVVGGICVIVFAPEINQGVIMAGATAIVGGIGIMVSKSQNVSGNGTPGNPSTSK